MFGLLLPLLLLAAAQDIARASPDDPAPEGLSVAVFLARWEVAVARNELNMAMPETRQLAAEITSTGEAYRALIDSQAAAGKTPRGCPARGSRLTIESSEIIAYFHTIPVAERGISVRDAMFALYDARYPCPAA